MDSGDSGYSAQFEARMLGLLNENIMLKNEVDRLRRKVFNLLAQIENLKGHPLPIGRVASIIEDNSAIVENTMGMEFFVNLPDNLTVKVGDRVVLKADFGAIIKVIPENQSYLSKIDVTYKPQVTYAEIGGLEQQIKDIREVIEYPLNNPEIFKRVGITPPKGVLLYGAPGTGKTLVAKAVANNTNANFIHIVGSELVQKYIGEGAKLVREIFKFAREKSPTIIFIDEIDSIGSFRMDVSTGGDREVQRTLMQLLSEIDGFNPLENVKIIGATNRIDIIDPALLRPGRFDRIIEFSLPDDKGKREIFNIYLKKMNVVEVDIDKIIKKEKNLSGAAIKTICTEAGMCAIRNNRDFVTQEDFDEALKRISEKEKKNTMYV